MSTVTAEQLDKVRQWAAEGVNLNGIQKRLASECGVQMTYMDVRFLLLDHEIEIATVAAAPKPEEKVEEAKPETVSVPHLRLFGRSSGSTMYCSPRSSTRSLMTYRAYLIPTTTRS